MTQGGYIKLYRKLQENVFWTEKRVFSRAEAWIDILYSANHKDNKFILGNKIIMVKRGSFITSEVKLMKKWGWSKSKVRAFLSLLEQDEMIVKKSDRKKTTVTIVNYGLYQDTQTINEPQKDRKKTAKRPQKDTNNNEKNDKNNNPPIVPPRKMKFLDYVYLTPDEHERLLNEYGEADTSRMIEILDIYIGAKPKQRNGYTDHNRVIRGWVKDRLEEEKERRAKVMPIRKRGEEGQEIDWGWTKET